MKDFEKLKETLQGTVCDMVIDLFYYDRKEDEELSREDIKELVEGGHVTYEEIAKWFLDEMNRKS